MKRILIVFILGCCGCSYTIKTTINPNKFILTESLDTTKIGLNGYYNEMYTKTVNEKNEVIEVLSTKEYTAAGILVFGTKKIMFNGNGGGLRNNLQFTCDYYKSIVERSIKYSFDYKGHYVVKNDSIYAFCPTRIVMAGGNIGSAFCNYVGYLKNKDTITGWRVVPPFSKKFDKFIIKTNKDLFEPKVLYFVKTDAVKCLKLED